MPVVHCEQFTDRQFMPVQMRRALLSVYIVKREERKENGGMGCVIQNVFTGKEERTTIAGLMKQKPRFTDNRKVSSFTLCGGERYLMVGEPPNASYGAFIVPTGDRYTYKLGDTSLPPGTCLIWDGQQARTMPWRQFRKQFTMLPNTVSKKTPVSVANAPVLRVTAIGRITQRGMLIGLVLSDGRRRTNLPLDDCIVRAKNGGIQNIKAVTRNGKTFLMGNGCQLEMLPEWNGGPRA